MCVRINSIETGLAEDDLRAALTVKVLPHSIVVPKVDTVEHLDWVKPSLKILAVIFYVQAWKLRFCAPVLREGHTCSDTVFNMEK